jgi:hypothetical protein
METELKISRDVGRCNFDFDSARLRPGFHNAKHDVGNIIVKAFMDSAFPFLSFPFFSFPFLSLPTTWPLV